MEFILDREKFETETGKKLYDMLKVIWDENDFITGIMAFVKYDEPRQKMIEFLNKTKTEDIDLIIEHAMKIHAEAN